MLPNCVLSARPVVRRQSILGLLAGRDLGANASTAIALGDTTDAITTAAPIHIAPLRTRLVQQNERWRFADRHFSESHLQMKQAYLVLASERRVLNVELDDDLDAIQRVIGCQTIEHGTTFQTEDQLIIGGDELGGVPQDRFWVCGVPFPFMECTAGRCRSTDWRHRRPTSDVDRRVPAADHLCHTVTVWRLPMPFQKR